MEAVITIGIITTLSAITSVLLPTATQQQTPTSDLNNWLDGLPATGGPGHEDQPATSN